MKSKLKAAKTKLWKVFSRYIRLRDGGRCISCGVVRDIREMDAGHYIPKTAGLSIYFEEKNVNCQCTGCNRFRRGNLAQYALALRLKYGKNILEELDAIRKQTVKFSVADYQEMIEKYAQKIGELV